MKTTLIIVTIIMTITIIVQTITNWALISFVHDLELKQNALYEAQIGLNKVVKGIIEIHVRESAHELQKVISEQNDDSGFKNAL